MKTVVLNGFGRIGKLFVQCYQEDLSPRFQLVAINDLKNKSQCQHAFAFDSIYGRSQEALRDYEVLCVSTPEDLLKHYSGALIVEATGKKRHEKALKEYLAAGASAVILSAPGVGEEIKTVCYGINHHSITDKQKVISNASCTTNALAPIVLLLKERYHIESLCVTTIHAATNDQCIQDSVHHDSRRARSVFNNLIPTETGASAAIKEIFPDLDCPIYALSIRSPHQCVSLLDLSVHLTKEVTLEELKQLFIEGKERLSGILDYNDSPLVSSDYKGDKHSVIIDGLTLQTCGRSVKILGWYDNEKAYAQRLYQLTSYLA